MEVEPSINALVSAFLWINGPSTDKTKRPPLELVWVFAG